MRDMSPPVANGAGPAQGTDSLGRVLVLSRAHLVRDTVRTALRSMGFGATSLGVPSGYSQLHAARRWLAVQRPETGLLVADFGSAADLRNAVWIVTEINIPWLVLTATPPCPAWGALIEAGAQDVMCADSTLQQVSAALQCLVSGEQRAPDGSYQDAIEAWDSLGESDRGLARRLESLSAREMQILVELHLGRQVKAIAEGAGSTESTVRGQVKAILRKLEANSQLAAVALYEQSAAWFDHKELDAARA